MNSYELHAPVIYYYIIYVYIINSLRIHCIYEKNLYKIALLLTKLFCSICVLITKNIIINLIIVVQIYKNKKKYKKNNIDI